MERRLEGKIALVTGASRGIGAAIAHAMAAEGASLIVNFRSASKAAEALVGTIRADGGQAVAVQADLSREADVRRLFAEARSNFGRLDVLVNNAGVYGFELLDDITPTSFHRMFDLNVLGLILACQEAARLFGPGGGSIINISSLAARAAPPTATVYSATKAAVDSVTRSLSQELGPRGIRVNSLNPGLVDTEGVRAQGLNTGEPLQQVEALTPLGRIGQPTDIAPAAVFLASDEAAWITGETFYISGGYR
ncbi:MAG: glucose 1-dehydrogenase [Methylotetracoccus sp.]